MKLNENTIKGKWLEVKGDVQKTWGKLTNDDLEKTKGDMKAIGGLIQQKYGEAQEGHQDKLAKIFSKMEDRGDKVVEGVKKSLK